MRLNSKDIGYTKQPKPVEKPIEIKTEVLDDAALLLKVEVMLKRHLAAAIGVIKDVIEKENEQEVEEEKKSYSCEIIRDDNQFIKEVKIKEQ